MATTVSELFVPVPWGEIRGRVWGPKHGYPVLCLHGWADNCGSFDTLIPLLPKDYRYVALDLAGHGLSSHHPPGVFYSLLSYVADVRRVISSLRMTKLSIIGHSMGGHIAGLFSAIFPEMVDALVLLDAKQFVVTEMNEIASKMRQAMDENIQFEKQSKKRKVYTYEKALERLLAAIPITKQSAQILLERGLTSVEGGFSFSRDLRVNFKIVHRLSLEQSLELHSKTKASVLVILAEQGFFENKLASVVQDFKERNHTLTSHLFQQNYRKTQQMVMVVTSHPPPCSRRSSASSSCNTNSSMSWLFLDWFVPLYLLVSVLVLAGFGACLYFLEPGLQDAHKWNNKTVRHHPLVASVNCREDDKEEEDPYVTMYCLGSVYEGGGVSKRIVEGMKAGLLSVLYQT
ncbi:hypothetical protein WMY93_006387 [Mugilogobius chulae]